MNRYDNISKSLGILEEQKLEPLVVPRPMEDFDLKKIRKDLLDKDQAYARSNLIHILEYAMEIMPDAIQVAKETETPRQLEAVSGFLKTIAEINKDLIGISREAIRDVIEDDVKELNTVINNQTAIFTGSTEDLISRLFPRKEN